MPFLEEQLRNAGCERILDSATGTGMHVIELRRRGYHADVADLSPGMIDKAKLNAKDAGVVINFKVAGFGQISQAFGGSPGYDALLCLDNSLPHLLTEADVVEAIDGPILLNECVGDPDECAFRDDCPMHPIWEDAQEQLVKRLRETTFATLTK